MKKLFIWLVITFSLSFATFAENYTSVLYDNVFYYYYSPDWKGFSMIQNEKIVQDWIVWKEYYKLDEHMWYSPDGKFFVYVAKKSENESVIVVNWIEWKTYKQIYNFKFSPDSKHLIYQAKKLNDKYVYIYDWIESKEYDGISNWDIFFSDNSASYAVVMGLPWTYQVIINWKETPFYENTFINSLVFSSDGKNYAYVWNIFDFNNFSNNSKRLSFLVQDWIKSEDFWYLDVSILGYVPNSSKLIYLSWSNIIVWNEIESKTDEQYIEDTAFDKKTGSYAYVVKINDKMNVVENSKALKSYYSINKYSINYNKNWELQYLAKKEKDWNTFFVKNWEEIDLWYKTINSFYSNWESIFFTTYLDEKWKIIYNWKESTTYNNGPSLYFSDDFKHFVYSVRDVNNTTNVYNYRFYKDLEQVIKIWYDIIWIVISPDWKSTTIAYKDKNNNYFVEKDWIVVSESKYEPFELKYSPNSQEIAYRINRWKPLDNMPYSYWLVIVKPITENSNVDTLTSDQKNRIEKIVEKVFNEFKEEIKKIGNFQENFIIVKLQTEINRISEEKSFNDSAKYAIFYLDTLVSDRFLNNMVNGEK